MKFSLDTNVLIDVLRDPGEEAAFVAFLGRFPQATYLSAVVMLELRAGARSRQQVRRLEDGVLGPFERRRRVFAPSVAAFHTAGELLAKLAVREGWTASAKPSLVHDALLAASCRELGVTLITRDADFARFTPFLSAWRPLTPWPAR